MTSPLVYLAPDGSLEVWHLVYRSMAFSHDNIWIVEFGKKQNNYRLKRNLLPHSLSRELLREL